MMKHIHGSSDVQEPWPILNNNLPYKMCQDFMDRQYLKLECNSKLYEDDINENYIFSVLTLKVCKNV